VLISEPCSWDLDSLGIPYLPYLFGLLKTHHEHHGIDPAHWEWLAPIWRYKDSHSLLESYLEQPIDVLGLSCYTWNWDLQCRLAQAVKTRYPECLVVAGGPQPDHDVPDFFRRHPYIDAVAVRDGEITFSRILDTLASGDRDLSSVKGLYLPDDQAPTGQRFTGPPDVPTFFDVSPYVAQADYYEQAIRESDHKFCATWESNRGCPFSCNFCDWGSSTMSKVRRFEMDRVSAELEWLGAHGASVIFLADANFGMLPRDVDLAAQVGDTFRKYGKPHSFAYNYAKNSPDRSLAISKALFNSGMPYKHVLSIQHTRKEVLAAADRENISSEQQIRVVQEIMKCGIPVEVQLILGIPGDTYKLWQGNFGDLMEWGIHGQYQVYLYHLLPNAPAAAAEFRERWQIGTVARCVYTSPHIAFIGEAAEGQEKNEIIVSSASYGVEDWVRMNVYAHVVKALHSAALTRLVADYLRRTHGVPYESFYSTLVDEWAVHTEWFSTLTTHARSFIDDEKASEFMAIEELPSYPHRVAAWQWVVVQACLSLDAFFESMSHYLVAKYPLAANLASLLRYQKNILILPSYDSRYGTTFATDLDWPGYFQQVFDTTPLPDPSPGSGGEVRATDSSCTDGTTLFQLNWSHEQGDSRWSAWLDRVVLGWNGPSRANFQSITLVSQSSPYPASLLVGEPLRGSLSANTLLTSRPE
jgi:putative methyltransferase